MSWIFKSVIGNSKRKSSKASNAELPDEKKPEIVSDEETEDDDLKFSFVNYLAATDKNENLAISGMTSRIAKIIKFKKEETPKIQQESFIDPSPDLLNRISELEYQLSQATAEVARLEAAASESQDTVYPGSSFMSGAFSSVRRPVMVTSITSVTSRGNFSNDEEMKLMQKENKDLRRQVKQFQSQFGLITSQVSSDPTTVLPGSGSNKIPTDPKSVGESSPSHSASNASLRSVSLDSEAPDSGVRVPVKPPRVRAARGGPRD